MAVVSYKCPCCGAGIAFDSEKQLFKCEYCLSEFTQEQLEAQTPKVDPVEEERTSKADSDEFCEKLLMDQRVAVVSGNAFGESGEGFIRCSYAYSLKSITKALDRIRKFAEKYI